VAGCCECGDESSGLIKYEGFLEDLLASQERLCSMELDCSWKENAYSDLCKVFQCQITLIKKQEY
jgi:hypothetical protein